jgi:hypothetical protein
MITLPKQREFASARTTAMKRWGVSLAMLALAASALAAPNGAWAATTCRPTSYRYNITQASVPIVIGVLSVNSNVCVGSNGKLSSSSASLTYVGTGPGSAAGWKWTGGSTRLVSSAINSANYVGSGGVQLCVPTQYSPLCAGAQTFAVNFHAYAWNFVGPLGLPSFSCVQVNCGLHFSRI